MRNILIVVGGLVVVAALAVGGYFLLGKSAPGPSSATAASPMPAPAAAPATPTPATPAPAPATPAPAATAPAPATPAPAAATPAPAPATPAPAAPAAATVPAVPTGLEVQPSDHVMGDPKAPITVIEYASMTCPHCADFAVNTLPEVKKQFIDTGKVKWVFRDFPLDQYAVRGSMLAECGGNDRYFALIEILFGAQRNWIRINDMDGTIAELGKIGRLAGISETEFKACMANQALLNAIVAERQGGEQLGVDSTPTFFINGNKTAGAMPFDEFVKLLK
jgi:protein-disulfide isomerase